jgi:hypothetical protein
LLAPSLHVCVVLRVRAHSPSSTTRTPPQSLLPFASHSSSSFHLVPSASLPLCRRTIPTLGQKLPSLHLLLSIVFPPQTPPLSPLFSACLLLFPSFLRKTFPPCPSLPLVGLGRQRRAETLTTQGQFAPPHPIPFHVARPLSQLAPVQIDVTIRAGPRVPGYKATNRWRSCRKRIGDTPFDTLWLVLTGPTGPHDPLIGIADPATYLPCPALYHHRTLTTRPHDLTSALGPSSPQSVHFAARYKGRPVSHASTRTILEASQPTPRSEPSLPSTSTTPSPHELHPETTT